MKRTGVLIAVLLLLGLPAAAAAGDDGALFTIFLARHAEKEAGPANPSDPSLAPCGLRRAEALAEMLANVELDAIYSTSYQRTLATARPSAALHGLRIETYDPVELEALAGRLLERSQDALVIGHSNTTGVLAGLLAGEPGEEFDESIYDRLYLVTVAGRDSRMMLLTQEFGCEP